MDGHTDNFCFIGDFNAIGKRKFNKINNGRQMLNKFANIDTYKRGEIVSSIDCCFTHGINLEVSDHEFY